jgi:hypothetical protein
MVLPTSRLIYGTWTMRKAYESKTKRLGPLLKHDKIIYDLVWAFFKPNKLLYTTYFATKQDRAIIFNVGEQKMDKFKVKYFSVVGRYRDFNGRLQREGIREHYDRDISSQV